MIKAVLRKSNAFALAAFLVIALASITGADVVNQDIWDTQTVNSTGLGTNPYIGSGTTMIRIEGIALNDSDDYLDPTVQFQVYVQGVGPDSGGIAAWAGSFYQGGPGSPEWMAEYVRLSTGWKEGDLIRIEGYIANNRGKTTINERHTGDPAMDFTITLLAADVGLPAPIVIPSVDACDSFDETRATGGELYQAQWSRLNDLSIISGTWASGQTVVVSDDGGTHTMNLLLSGLGTFDTAPVGAFDAIGIFDQEDLTSPFTGDYRLWIKDQVYVVPEPGAFALMAAGLAVVALSRRKAAK
ncbi:MAG TPA: PEP-CTERM sorting domain-containing protein [Candidatus Brocadiia bacterium]|nr:PEP-CTERM sorting domain-containing protein [Candidatus Brocadiia bacterium]